MPDMQQLIFGEGLMIPTLEGRKRITLRKYRAGAHDFREQEAILGVFKDGLNILLWINADTEKKPFNALTDEEAREDGFENAKDAFENLKEYYPDLKLTDICAIIRYQVLNHMRVPAVSLNEHRLVLE